MSKYLIFRNDRIGDFLISAILIKSIKRNDKNAEITVIASNKNYEYIKSFAFVDKVILFENTFINKIRLIIKLRSNYFKYVIVHDNKNRSHVVTLFLNYYKKLSIKIIKPHIEIIKDFLSELNFTFEENDLNILENRKLYFKINFKDYIIFHFDEKWFKKNYNSSYTDIEPSASELIQFINSISSKKRMKLVITTGINTPEILISLNQFFKDNKIIFFNEINYFQLESLICNCKLLVSCHGFVSHVAAAYDKSQIDIIDNNFRYNYWTKHFRNYDYIFRTKFSSLHKLILKKL